MEEQVVRGGFAIYRAWSLWRRKGTLQPIPYRLNKILMMSCRGVATELWVQMTVVVDSGVVQYSSKCIDSR